MARFPAALSGVRAALFAVAVVALSASQAFAQYSDQKKIEITPVRRLVYRQRPLHGGQRPDRNQQLGDLRR